MDTPKEDEDLPYTIFTKVPGKPQMLKLAPVYGVEEEPVREKQYPLAGVPTIYPLG
jgi:hypothetical protein